MCPYTEIAEIQGIKPFIPVTFEFNGSSFTFTMLVDSGSDITTLPPELAEFFGINDITTLPEGCGHGAGGTFRYREFGEVKIIIDEEIEITCPIKFSESMISFPFGLLGRKGVFDCLRIAFKQKKYECIYLAKDNC